MSNSTLPAQVGSTDQLGPLPEPGRVVSEPPAFYKDDWKHHKLYTADQMRAYALAERERCITAVFAWANEGIDRKARSLFSAPTAAEQIVKRL